MKWALNISMNRDYFTEITNQMFVKRKRGILPDPTLTITATKRDYGYLAEK